jgi:type I restriction enzyme S subunit
MSDSLLTPENRAFPKSVQPGIPKLAVPPDGWSVVPMRAIVQPVQRPVQLERDETYQLVTARRSRGGIVARERLKGRDILTKTQSGHTRTTS